MAKANGERSVEDADKVSADGEPAACESKGARAQNCCCHHKATPRSEELQHNLQKAPQSCQLAQLNGVKAMIDDNRYCGDVLTQLAAAESAVHSISAILLQNHLETCVVEQIEAGQHRHHRRGDAAHQEVREVEDDPKTNLRRLGHDLCCLAPLASRRRLRVLPVSSTLW